MTPAEVVEQVLTHIERTARQTTPEAPYDGLLRLPELPMTALAEIGPLTRLDSPAQRDALPSLLLESDSGQAQIEVCPFGPLALITSDGDMNTDPIAQALSEADILPLFPGDIDTAGRWHGTPLGQWLFPRRLSDALQLFDALRPA